MRRLLMLAALTGCLLLAGSAQTVEATGGGRIYGHSIPQFTSHGHHHPHWHHHGHYGYYPHRHWGGYFRQFGWRPWYGRSGFYVRGPSHRFGDGY